MLERRSSRRRSIGPDGLSRMLDDGLALGPTIDGDLITRPTLASLAAGVGADKPLVLGATDDEFSMAVARAKNTLRWIPLALLLGRTGLARDRRRAYVAANSDVRASRPCRGARPLHQRPHVRHRP